MDPGLDGSVGLLQEGANPADSRDTAASFLVNQGTSPNAVTQEGLQWIADHAQTTEQQLTFNEAMRPNG